MKFKVVGERNATKYIQKELNRLKRVKKLCRCESQPIFYFLRLPMNRMVRTGANHLNFSNRDFRFPLT